MTNATIIIKEGRLRENPKEIQVAVRFSANDPVQAMSKALCAKKNRDQISRFCLFGDYPAVMTDDATGEVIAEGTIEANVFAGRINTQCHKPLIRL